MQKPLYLRSQLPLRTLNKPSALLTVIHLTSLPGTATGGSVVPCTGLPGLPPHCDLLLTLLLGNCVGEIQALQRDMAAEPRGLELGAAAGQEGAGG